MSNVAKSLTNVATYVKRWKERIGAKRFHRVYDDRDQALADALGVLEAKSDSYYPAILTIIDNLTVVSEGTSPANVDLVMTGTNLVGDAEKAEGATADSTGKITFTAVLPGLQTITVTLEDDGGSITVTADADAGTIAITHDGDTAADIIAIVNADAEAKFMVQAVATTAGAIDADETVSVTTSGADPGTLPSMALGSQSFVGSTAGFGITAWTDTQITFDMDVDGYTVGATYMLRLWVDDVLVLSVPVTIVT